MANPEHLEILKKGVDVWNEWRDKNPRLIIELRDAELRRANLIGANLSDARLGGADLNSANVNRADLSRANLISAILSGANLSGADLNRAYLFATLLREANLSDAFLRGADLHLADLYLADLRGADLRGASLGGANLIGANMIGADLSETVFYGTVIDKTDLSEVKGLDTIEHLGPSTIGIDTIYHSKGNIPEVFLRGVGFPDNFIEYIGSLVGKAIDYHSCFISYSSKDQEFSERLHADLQAIGVRVWFAREDLKIGAKTRVAIDETIRKYDKLLLVLSDASVNSDWVEQEVETALAKEREEKRLVLFPVRLDDTIEKVKAGWPALLWNTRNIGDFCNWKDHDAYQKALKRLMRDLKAEIRNQD